MLSPAQREFIDSVLESYIKGGIDELDDKKLGTVIQSKVSQGKYKSVEGAERVLGDIRSLFTDFQHHLYDREVA